MPNQTAAQNKAYDRTLISAGMLEVASRAIEAITAAMRSRTTRPSRETTLAQKPVVNVVGIGAKDGLIRKKRLITASNTSSNGIRIISSGSIMLSSVVAFCVQIMP